MPGARRRARNIALQLLYEIDVSGHDYLQTVNHTEGYTLLSEENRQFVFDIVAGIDKHHQEIDAYINRFAPAWPVSQLAVIDRNILRLAIYELLYVLIRRIGPYKQNKRLFQSLANYGEIRKMV